MSLPPEPLKTPFINVTWKKKVKNQGKYVLLNNLINEYRAKLFSKAYSPEIIIEIENEILDIPKKVTQAFGRTTFTFYFKQDINGFFNANRNINNFGYSRSKKAIKLKIIEELILEVLNLLKIIIYNKTIIYNIYIDMNYIFLFLFIQASFWVN